MNDPQKGSRGGGTTSGYETAGRPGTGRESGGGDYAGRSSSGKQKTVRDKNLGTIHGDLFTRPLNFDKTGTSGIAHEFRVNFVPVETFPETLIFQYHVQFEPDIDSKDFRQKILLQPDVVSVLGPFFIFDGMIMYLNREWDRECVLVGSHPKTNAPIQIRFKNSVRFSHNDPQAINVYNVILRRCFDQIGLKQMGRNYFDPSRSMAIQDYDMEVWPGYETAIRLYEDKLMLCIENRFKMLRLENVNQMLDKEFLRAGRNFERFVAMVDETLKGQTVVTYYNNKLHTVSYIDYNMTPESTFQKADGAEVTLAAYIYEQYGITIKDMEQPIIVCEGKPKQPGEPPQKTYIVPELCTPTGLTDDMRKDFRLMRALSHHTRLDPNKRAQSTRELLRRLHTSAECCNLFENWHFRFAEDIAGMVGRVLPPERLMGSRNFEFVGQRAEWARDLKRAGSFRTAHLTSWVLIYPQNTEEMAVHFYNRLGALANGMHMGVAQPIAIPLQNTQPREYQIGIQQAIEQRQNGSQPVCMVVVMLPDDNKTRYDTLKKWLCTSFAIPSQCVLLKTLAGKPNAGGDNRNFDSIVLKILLQMNCKMGGALWKVKIPLKDTMIVGYDLYHDSTLKGKTVGACVSTYDQDFTEFYSQTRPHENPTQLGNNLKVFIRKALHHYQEANKSLPRRIILYRDGAGDGQIPYIRDQEVRLVKDACEEVVQQSGYSHGEDFKILLSFTIVTKKVNMRIFRCHANQLVNPEPGTVVDNTVTRPERFDFYLVPQFVNQGTVTPVCYNVIYDDTQLTPDKHQVLAFKLSHMYFNWSGTIRVPAPCQYAHKLAFLVAQSIHQDPDESLKTKLFFL